MTVSWDHSISAKVKSDFSFSGVKFDVDTSATEGDNLQETGHLQDRERAEYFMNSMPLFLKDLAVHCEGLAPLPQVESQDVIDLAGEKAKRESAT